MFGLPEDSEENLRDSYNKLTDMEYNMLDSIHPGFYKIRQSDNAKNKADKSSDGSDIMNDLEGFGYEVLPNDIQKSFESMLGYQIDVLMTRNKHGLTTMRCHNIAVATGRKFLENKYFANRPPVDASNKLREQKMIDLNRYWNRVMTIQKHNRYDTVTLYNGPEPITLTVQEYKDTI